MAMKTYPPWLLQSLQLRLELEASGLCNAGGVAWKKRMEKKRMTMNSGIFRSGTALTPVTVPEAGGLLEAAISIKVWILLLQPRGKKEYGVDITTYAVYM